MRDYLQKEIEKQLRTLMMDELPAIIHRLSLRLWCPEYRAKEAEELVQAARLEQEEVAIDPLASPPQDAVDSRGNVLDASEISNLTLEGGSSEIHSLFSQKNLLRLAALTDSHRTLSLFTPSIRDAVFRAWAGPTERTDSIGSSSPGTPSLTRGHSVSGSSSTTYTFNRGSDDGHGHLPARPSLVNVQSATTGLALGSNRHGRSHLKKKKNRIVNLRKTKTTDDVASASESTLDETASILAASEPIMECAPEEPEDNIITPPLSPSQKVHFREKVDPVATSKPQLSRPELKRTDPEQVIAERSVEREQLSASIFNHEHKPSYDMSNFGPYPIEKTTNSAAAATTNASVPLVYEPAPVLLETSSAGGILEQAWMLKMAGEIARRAQQEKSAREAFWSQSVDDREVDAPPAYEPRDKAT